MTTGKKLKKQDWAPMSIPDAIIKKEEYLAAQDRRSGSSVGYILCDRNYEIFDDETEGDDAKPLTEQEAVHLDIPSKLPGVELDRKQNVPTIKEADTENSAVVESASAHTSSVRVEYHEVSTPWIFLYFLENYWTIVQLNTLI